mmetsp:Transcript_52526/g.139879  ORF Transcript_52526/g.139879 Transcript_52526/m.139879 type:complete len:90 (-) Transcript_52526:794-1063(-)
MSCITWRRKIIGNTQFRTSSSVWLAALYQEIARHPKKGGRTMRIAAIPSLIRDRKMSSLITSQEIQEKMMTQHMAGHGVPLAFTSMHRA